MFRYFKRQQDIKSKCREPAALNFGNSDWILDHHRHNLIQKIVRPDRVPGVLPYLWSKLSSSVTTEANNKSQADQNSGENGTQDPWKKEDNQFTRDVELGTELPVHGQVENSRESYRINFCELQRMHLRQLQYKLVNHVVKLTYGGKPVPGWSEDLRDYVQALQDYDYMGKHMQPSRDPFYVTGERIVDRCMLDAAMKGKENPKDPLLPAQSMGKWEMGNAYPKPVGGTRTENFQRAWVSGFRHRVGAAIVGGIFLIGPMWLMVLHKTRYTALISTTLFVTVFGLLMALVLDKLMDVLSSTAAYAAVLVVFVGLST